MTLPNFLIIGTAKAGTTSLHHYLDQHPDIFMCRKKDTFFFNFDGRDPDYGGPSDNDWYRGRAVVHRDDYEALFDGVTTEMAIGEACPQYLYDPDAASRIHRYTPDAKLIAVLRDPVERAYSSYLQQVRDGLETETDFAAALSREDDRIRANWRPMWHYRARGFYFEQLERYLSLFGAKQVRLYLYEDLQREPAGLLREIYGFLGVDDRFEADISVRHNRAGIPRSRGLYNLIMTPNKLKTVVRPLLPVSVRRMLKGAVIDSGVNLQRPDIPAELRRSLMSEFRDDILALQGLIDRDLSHWMA